MPKVDPDILKAFGRAVKLARGKRGWNQKQLGDAFDPPIGNSIISKVEKGQKETLGFTSVGRFRQVLDLDESWLEKFLDAEENTENFETKAEREADQIFERIQREGAAEGASDDLLIQLANNFTKGEHKDTETAYRSVKAALETLKASEDIAQLAGNADAQFAALMQQVDQLNQDGDFEEAAQVLDQEGARIERLGELHLEKQINQDRLRNMPARAAERLVADIRRQAPAGGVFRGVVTLAAEWRDNGDRAGDMFALQVALEMAKLNYETAKGKKKFEPAALNDLGWCHLRIAERSSKDGHLKVARNVFEAAVTMTNKAKDPLIWAALQNGFGVALQEMGERGHDQALLEKAVAALRAALKVNIAEQGHNRANSWDSLGIALQTLGKLIKSADALREAEDATSTALALRDKSADPLGWEATQGNLAVAQRWLGAITQDLAKLDQARAGYKACEDLNTKDKAAFIWASLQWNIADLAFARFQLDPDPAHLVEARTYLAQARAVFVEGSEYQTQRCDELLAQIEAAEAG